MLVLLDKPILELASLDKLKLNPSVYDQHEFTGAAVAAPATPA